jgi:hypothetical protein
MLTTASAPFYSVRLNGTEVANCVDVPAANCISSQEVASEVLTLYYRYATFVCAVAKEGCCFMLRCQPPLSCQHLPAREGASEVLCMLTTVSG